MGCAVGKRVAGPSGYEVVEKAKAGMRFSLEDVSGLEALGALELEECMLDFGNTEVKLLFAYPYHPLHFPLNKP